jgi:aspartate 4-decarboxylase
MSATSDDRTAGLSPFELKDRLAALATECTRANARLLLDAGRANPDWLALEPRDAFVELERFALNEARARSLGPGLGGHPEAPGIAARLFAATAARLPGAALLREAVEFARERLAIDPDALVHELTLAALGVNYPTPVRMLASVERVLQIYLERELCRGESPVGALQLFATEGATAGICYVFQSLLANRLLERGDRIAIGVPAFTPYLEIPRLDAYRFEEVHMAADGDADWQYPEAEIAKLADPTVRALFLVNPGNPTAVAIDEGTLERIAALVRSRRSDLIVISDDVYAAYAQRYRSLAAVLPHNTITVFSLSKYFGCTGWRLGVVGIREDNILDERLARLPAGERDAIAARYAGVCVDPARLRFIDRMVADSRAVALNHTAGLSTPQQVQLALFALHALLGRGAGYRDLARSVVHERHAALYAALGIPAPGGPLHTDYYATVDLLALARSMHGAGAAARLARSRHPLDFVFDLAREYATVVLPGAGFDAPDWSIRISLANLPAAAYREIGGSLRALLAHYLASDAGAP